MIITIKTREKDIDESFVEEIIFKLKNLFGLDIYEYEFSGKTKTIKKALE